MELFRAIYVRNGKVAGQTFALPHSLFVAEEAHRYAQEVVMSLAKRLDPKAELLTVRQAKSRSHG